MALGDFQDLVDDLVRDDTGKITEFDRDEVLALAIERYSKDRPRTAVEDLTSAGGHLLDLPAAWESDFSKLASLETPIGEIPTSLIPNAEWRLYRSPSDTQIQLDAALAATAQVRATFTQRHSLDGTTDTVPPGDREAVSNWAAALLLDQLANLFSGDSDSTIQADRVDQKSKATEFAERARAARRRYFNELGVDPKRKVAAGVVVDLDHQNSLGGDRLTHPGRLR